MEALAILLRTHRRPFRCFFCKKQVKDPPASSPASGNEIAQPWHLVAHHKNNFHEDLDSSNLAPAHVICHNEHHRTPEGRDSARKMKKRINQANHQQKER